MDVFRPCWNPWGSFCGGAVRDDSGYWNPKLYALVMDFHTGACILDCFDAMDAGPQSCMPQLWISITGVCNFVFRSQVECILFLDAVAGSVVNSNTQRKG